MNGAFSAPKASLTVTKRILMLAFHFPPIQGSSGVHRTLSFAKYLAEHGWQPTVLTADPKAYEAVRLENLALVPSTLEVRRSFARDSAKAFSIRGRYPKLLALPDRWSSWAASAVARGLALIKRDRPTVIYSTYPIASAHLAGLVLRRLTNLPWVADFRDPMAEPGYPPDRAQRRVYQWIEREAARRAARLLVTSPGTRDFYIESYLKDDPSRVVVIENGFDEELAASYRDLSTNHTIGSTRRILLLHSGIIYPRQRDPSRFFAALAELKNSNEIDANSVHIRLRASGNEEEYRIRLESLGISDLVSLDSALGYAEATREMAQADGLLLLQSEVCNRQIPAKAYEYLALRKPILGLASRSGDTGRLLLDQGIDTVAALEDKEAIKSELRRFLHRFRHGTHSLPDPQRVSTLSRRARTKELAALLDDIANV